MNNINSYNHLFSNLIEVDPRKSLNDSIMYRINRSSLIQNRVRIFIHSLVSIVTAVSIVPVMSYIFNSSRDAGLFEYISLMLSDWSTTAAHWKEITYSVIDSLPLTEIAILLLALMILINSLARIPRYLSLSKFGKIAV